MKNHKCRCGETKPDNFYGAMYSRCKTCDDAQKTARRLAKKERDHIVKLASGNYYKDTAGRVVPLSKLGARVPRPVRQVDTELQELERRASEFHQGNFQFLKDILKEKIKSARKRARSKGKAFTIDYKDLLRTYNRQMGLCVYTEVPMKATNHHGYTPSLDRIDSQIGYTPENIQFLLHNVNTMKSNFTENVFIKLCKRVATMN